MSTEQDPRAMILEGAMSAVLQDRNVDYGDPEDNFRDIAKLWNVYAEIFRPNFIHDGFVDESNSVDVAVLMILVKIARLKESPTKADHWMDIAGYAACGYQAAKAEEE